MGLILALPPLEEDAVRERSPNREEAKAQRDTTNTVTRAPRSSCA